MTDSTFIKRVVLMNYKSIAACDVRLGPLTYLVGPNGAGKSNFLDALRFVSDGLRLSLDQVVNERSGQFGLQHRASDSDTGVGLRLEFVLPDGRYGHYALLLKLESVSGYRVEQEQCVLRSTRRAGPRAYYSLGPQTIRASFTNPPATTREQLYLVRVSGIKEFQDVYELLQGMRFYQINVDSMRGRWLRATGQTLAHDGSNIAEVIDRLQNHSPSIFTAIQEYLTHVVPGVSGVAVSDWNGLKILEFEQQVDHSWQPWRFMMSSVSDGTLRTLGILTALFQAANETNIRVPLVGIEEPESQLHPAAAGALRDILREASTFTQVLVTTHSADLLDDKSVLTESILSVVAERGATLIGQVDDTGCSLLRDRLFTAGELLRMNQLTPDLSPSTPIDVESLFDKDLQPA